MGRRRDGDARGAVRKGVQAIGSLPTARASTESRSFASVAERHLDDVYAYLVYVVGDPQLAEDLAADTFVKALASWKRFDPRRAGVKTWLCLIARSVALDHLRSEERRRRREDSFGRREHREATEGGFAEGLPPKLDEALRELSAADREVVCLRVLLELDGKQTARVLGMSETACATRLSRALQKLKAKVEDHAFSS